MYNQPHEASTAPTLGIDFVSQAVTSDGMRIRLNTYDTSGQERFQALTPSYLRTADIVLIVLSATLADDEMANQLKKWCGVANREAPPTMRVIVAITRCDTVGGMLIVGPATGAQLVRCGLKRYHVVTGASGFCGTGVKVLWDDVVDCATKCCKAREPARAPPRRRTKSRSSMG